MAIPDMYAHARPTALVNKRNATHNSKPDTPAIQMRWRGREKDESANRGSSLTLSPMCAYGFLKIGHRNIQVKEFISRITI
jgi:hypothetical protein